MAMIRIHNLTFGYEGSSNNVFENVTVTLDTDWRLGLSGRNGRGKTTLLRLLAGTLTGRGEISGGAGFSYFPYPINHPERFAIEVVEDVNPDCGYWQIAKELSLLGVDEDILYRAYGTLSGGERTKLLLAAMFTAEGRFMLIDEPTNHLDAEGRAVLAAYLAKKKGFILVSHDRAFLDGAIDHVLSLNRGSITVEKGNMTAHLENMERTLMHERAENLRLKKEIVRLEDAKRQAAGFAAKAEKKKFTGADNASGLRPDRGHLGHVAAKMMKRSKAIEGRISRDIEEKETLLKDSEYTAVLRANYIPYFKERLLSVENLCVAFGEKTVLKDVHFELFRGECVALTGKNGSGKSTLLKAVLGTVAPTSGRITLGSGLKISYVRQDTEGMCGSIREYARGLDAALFFAMLIKLGMERKEFDRPVEQLSEGQKKKVLLARSLTEEAHLYVWDEPLNYVDMISRLQIEAMLVESNASMLIVEHDAKFIEGVATREIQLL